MHQDSSIKCAHNILIRLVFYGSKIFNIMYPDGTFWRILVTEMHSEVIMIIFLKKSGKRIC